MDIIQEAEHIMNEANENSKASLEMLEMMEHLEEHPNKKHKYTNHELLGIILFCLDYGYLFKDKALQLHITYMMQYPKRQTWGLT